MIMAGALTISGIPAIAFADEAPAVVTGTYKFTSADGEDLRSSDSFTFREDCFMQSSFTGCSHLATLSSQAALAAGSYYGPDPAIKDVTRNPENILNMLSDMGFENVKANEEYTSEEYINTTGVAVGKHTVTADGKTYTLLAIIIRGAGYRQEWAGNFTTGDNGFHEGFKSARDEALRFVKQYIKDNGISGDIKVWTTGHSRGGAIANLVGGFFAGGGIDYFDGAVSITPEDVYCYTYATPNNVKPGVDNSVILSVESNRGTPYVHDTPMDAYISKAEGTLDPGAGIFNGIRSYTADYDLISLLPPTAWSFTNYGKTISVDNGGAVTFAEMEAELAPLSAPIMASYKNGGNVNSYTPFTFDLENLALKPSADAKVPATYTEFINDRVSGLIAHVADTDVFKNQGYQDALSSMAGLFGMLRELNIDADPAFSMDVLVPAAGVLLSYFATSMKEKGVEATEPDLYAMILESLLSVLTKKNIDHKDATIDYLVETFLTYVFDSCTVAVDTGDEPEVEYKYLVPNNTLVALILSGLKAGFTKLTHLEAPDRELDYAFYNLIAPCVIGTDESPAAASRQSLYLLATFALGSSFPEMAAALAPAEGNTFSGSKSDTELILALLPLLLTEKDADGNIVKTYATVDEMANAKLPATLAALLGPVGSTTDERFAYYSACADAYKQNIINNAGQAALVVLDLFCYDDGAFDLQRVIDTIATFVGNAGPIANSHYNEVYTSWMKAYEKKYDEGAHPVAPEVIASPTGSVSANVFMILILASMTGLVTVTVMKRRKEN